MFFELLVCLSLISLNIILISICFDSWQKYKRFDIASDVWLSKEFSFVNFGVFSYDKLQHFIVGFILGLLSGSPITFTLSIFASILWEVKDGLYSYKVGGKWGGDGFSIKDLFAQFIGLIIGYFL